MTQPIVNYIELTILHGTVLALITWLLSVTVLRRSRPAIKAVLWIIVLVKFLIPPVLPGEMMLSSWVTKTVAAASNAVFVSHTEKPKFAENQEFDHAQNGTTESTGTIIRRAVFSCYLGAVGFLGAWSIVAFRRTRRRIRLLAVADDDLVDEVAALAELINIKGRIDVRLSDGKRTPYVVGLWPSTLVVPLDLLNLLDPIERHALILHELAHVRRKDQIVRWLENVICVFLFFWPPVWLICRRIEHFTEMACDQWAIDVSKVDPQSYARSLLDAIKNFNPTNVQNRRELAFARNVKLLEERLIVVLEHGTGQSPRISWALTLALAGWAVFVLAGGSMAESRTEHLIQTAVDSSPNAQTGVQVNPDTQEQSPNRLPTGGLLKRVKRNSVVSVPLGVSQNPEDSKQIQTKPADLTPYEQGVLLGLQEAERRARLGYGESQPLRSWDIEEQSRSKREIERNLQALGAQSRRKQ